MSFCTALLKELACVTFDLSSLWWRQLLSRFPTRAANSWCCERMFHQRLEEEVLRASPPIQNMVHPKFSSFHRPISRSLSEFHATLRQLALHNRAAILVTGTHPPRQYAQSSCGSLARTPGNESSQRRDVQTSSLKDCDSFKTSPWPASSCPQCRRLEAIQHRS